MIPSFQDPSDFETFVAIQFQQLGYRVEMPEKNKRGYDIEISKGPEKIAVQVKNYKRKCNLGQLTKFIEFLDLPIAAGFTSGIFVSSYGFSRPALTSIESEEPGNLSIATCTDKGLEFHYRPAGTSVKQYPTAPDEFDLSDDSENPDTLECLPARAVLARRQSLHISRVPWHYKVTM